MSLFSILGHFCPFTHIRTGKMKISKKWQKKLGDIIILHKCTKNKDYVVYCTWDMTRDRCNCYFSFWTIFCPFTLLTAQKHEKFFLKKTRLWDVIILHRCTKNNNNNIYNKIIIQTILFLRYGVWQI